MSHRRGRRALSLGALLVLLPATTTFAEGDGTVPADEVKEWREFDQLYQRVKKELGPYAFTSGSYTIPDEPVAREQWVKFKELQKGVIPEAKAAAAKVAQKHGENPRSWPLAWKQKWGVTKRIRGWEELVLEMPKGADGKELSLDTSYRNLTNLLEAANKWPERIVSGFLRDYQKGTEFSPKEDRSLSPEALDEQGRWRRVVDIEAQIAELEAWAKVHPDFAAFPAAYKKKAEQVQKDYDDILAKWTINEKRILTEDTWKGEDYEEVLEAAYELHPEAKTIVLSGGWKVSDRNILERPIQYHVEAYVVLPKYVDEEHNLEPKDAAAVKWTNLYTERSPDAKQQAPFKSTGSTRYYLIANDNVPDDTRPGGFFSGLLKLLLAGGCCVLFLGVLGGGGYFAYTQVQGKQAAAAAAAAGEPGAPGAPMAPGAPPHIGGAVQAGGMPPAPPPTAGQNPAPPQTPPAAGQPPADPNQPPPPAQA